MTSMKKGTWGKYTTKNNEEYVNTANESVNCIKT